MKKRIKFNMNNQNLEDKSLTTLAFVIGLTLIENLSSTEQNAVGNWIMLIAKLYVPMEVILLIKNGKVT